MMHLIPSKKVNDYLVKNKIVDAPEIDVPLQEYQIENGNTAYYNMKDLIEFMKDDYFEMVPGYPNTKTKHVDNLASLVIQTLVESKYVKKYQYEIQ